jgi:hypothetical protein
MTTEIRKLLLNCVLDVATRGDGTVIRAQRTWLTISTCTRAFVSCLCSRR